MSYEQCSPGCPGWVVFNGNEIQRCDECARFADDGEAIAYVERLYFEDSARAAQAAEPWTRVYVCPECGCVDVEGTGWIHLNSDRLVGDDAPLELYWCPRCEGNISRVCLVDSATGKCLFHAGHTVVPVTSADQAPTGG